MEKRVAGLFCILLAFLGVVAAGSQKSRNSAPEFRIKSHNVKVADILPKIKLEDPFVNPFLTSTVQLKRQNVLPVNDSFLQSAVVCTQYSNQKRSEFFERDTANSTTGDIVTTDVVVDTTGTTGTTDTTGTTGTTGTTDTTGTTGTTAEQTTGTTAAVSTTGINPIPDPPVISMCVEETTTAPGDDTQAHDLVFNPATNEFVAVTVNEIQQTVQNKRQQVQTLYSVVGHRYDSNGILIGTPFFLVAVIDGKFRKDHIQLSLNTESNIFLAVFELQFEVGSEIWSIAFDGTTYAQISAQSYTSPGTYDRFPQITYNPITSAFLISWEFRNSVDLDTDTFVARVSDTGLLLSATAWGSLFDDRAPDVAFNPLTGGYHLVMEVGFGIYGFTVSETGVPTAVNFQFLSNPEQNFLDHDPTLIFEPFSATFLLLWETRLSGTQNNVIFQRKLNFRGEPIDSNIRVLVDQNTVPFASSAEPIYDAPSNHFLIFYSTSDEFLNAENPQAHNIKLAVVENNNALTINSVTQLNTINFNEHHPNVAVNPINHKYAVIWGHGLEVDTFVDGPVATADPSFNPIPFTTAAAVIPPLTPQQTASIVVPVLIAVGAGVAIAIFVGLMFFRKRMAQQATLDKAATELEQTAAQREAANS